MAKITAITFLNLGEGDRNQDIKSFHCDQFIEKLFLTF